MHPAVPQCTAYVSRPTPSFCIALLAASGTHSAHVQGGWQNRILARLANEMSRYNPINYVAQVKAPVLMVATTRDALCNIDVARRAASLNPLVKLVEKDAGESPISFPRHSACVPRMQRRKSVNAALSLLLLQRRHV